MQRAINNGDFTTTSSISPSRRQSFKREGAVSRFSRALTSTDELDSTLDEENEIKTSETTTSDHHSFLQSSYSPIIGEDSSSLLAIRRPSSASNHSSSGSASGKARRPSTSSHNNSYAQSGPRSSSRSKILASSAASLENSVLSAHEYRIRSGSRDRDIMIDASKGLTLPPSPMSTNDRLLPSSPKLIVNRSGRSNSSVSSIIGQSKTVAERKRRLTSASSSSAKLPQSDTLETNLNSQRSTLTRASNSSMQLPLEFHNVPPMDEAKTIKAEEEKKPSLRSRLFGLRKAPKEVGDASIDTSDTASIASTVNSTDYSKETSPTQAKISPPRLKVENKTSRPVSASKNDLLSPESALRSANTPMPSMTNASTGDASWITSLSNVSPSGTTEYDSLHLSPISVGNSGGESPASPDSRLDLFRTTSWPSRAERGGSFVSVQGSASGVGYRFENAAAHQIRTNLSPSPTAESPSNVLKTLSNALQVTSITPEPQSNVIAPSFLSFDPSPTMDSPPPVERREKSRSMVTRLGSPAPSDIDLSDAGRRLRTHMHSDSSSSLRSTQSTRSPQPRLRNFEGGNRRSHWRNSSALSMSWQDGQLEGMTTGKFQKRRSTTAIGLTGALNIAPITSATSLQSLPSNLSTQSVQSLPPVTAIADRPSFATTQSQPPVSSRQGLYGSPISPAVPMPRSSSLSHGRNSSYTMSRNSSNTNSSFMSAGSPIEVLDEYMQSKDQFNHTSPGSISIDGKCRSPGASAAGIVGGSSTSTILARLTTSGVEEKVIELNGDLATLSSVDRMSEGISRDSDLDKTLSLDAPQPTEKKGHQFIPGEEPKRPTKSPLRKVSSKSVKSIASSQNTSRSSPVKPGPGSDRRLATSTSSNQNGTTRFNETNEETVLRNLGQNPPRQSFEDVAQLRALADNHFTAVAQPNSDSLVTSEVLLAAPLVPQSARRLVDVTGSNEKRESLSTNEWTESPVTEKTGFSLTNTSTNSFTTETEVEALNTPINRDQQLQSLNSPALASAFSRVASGPNSGSRAPSMTDQGIEDEVEDVTVSAISMKKKTKKWPFHSKDSPGETVETERRVPSMGSKMANSLRGRKSEPQQSRPLIRRVYDDPHSEEGQDEAKRVISSDSTKIHNPNVAAFAASRSEMRESLVQSSLPSLESGPTTPTMTQDEMKSEVKKLVHRRNVIRELVETEKSYSSDLAVVRDIYLARAKSVVGLSSVTSLQTPLSGYGTPTGTPNSLSHFSTKSSPLYTSHRNVQRMASSELRLPPSSPNIPSLSHSTASPSSFASSSEPSNRSSTYTVSSQTSQASDSSFPFNVSGAPPLPATPPNLASLNTSASGNTLHATSPSSITSVNTVSATKSSTNKPKMQVSTTSLPLHNTTPVHTPSDVGFTVTDLRVMFAHLEACCAFSEDMSSVLAGCMGTFARSKPLDSADVTVDMDKEDDRLGETFLQLMPRIRKIYIEYCSRHEAGMLRLQEVLAASPKASSIFKESTELARKHTNAWDLASLLIKPVQRVLKYPLLIQQIVNSTAKSHPDYVHLSLAFEEIQAVADEINQVKKRKDLAETLITGRIREAKGTMTSTSTLKGKRRPEYHSEDGLLTPFGGEEAALEEYAVLYKEFQALLDYVARFSSQCTTWTRSLRESYESQINVMKAIRRTYRLQIEEVGPDGIIRAKENKEALKSEERLTAKYTKLLQTIYSESCRQVERNTRSTVLPLIVQIADSFESPQAVVAKRDERQADYLRYRQNLLAGRQSDRKVLESVNGFIALNAQLVEELPLFLQGVRTLLRIGVYSFAQLQAGHFQEVRNQTINFWNDVAKKSSEVELNDKGILSMRPVNPVRVFWNRHSVTAAWIDSLGIVRRDGNIIVEDGDTSSSSSTPGLPSTARMLSGTYKPESSEAKYETTSTILNRPGSSHLVPNDNTTPSINSQNNNNSNSYLQSTTPARRPNLVGTLMRTISGTFVRDQDGEIIPPLPSDAAARHMSGSSSKLSSVPMLPNLAFKDKDGENGYFIQSGPIPFLDTKEKERSKQPYDSSPSEISKSLSGHSSRNRSESNLSSISVQASGTRQALPGEESGDAPRRQRMNVLFVCVANTDSRLELQDRSHLGWPFVAVVKGDTLRVLSSSDSVSIPLLFGRIDRSGEVGWAEKRCF